jgi:catechol 2,3-dioxygenase-like lactoylglutathione lyase family enzyme
VTDSDRWCRPAEHHRDRLARWAEPIALRDVVPGTDLASVAQPGIGAAIWLHATDVQAIHDAHVAGGHTIVSAPIDGPFGRTFTFADPDGYQVTLHDRA